MSPEVKQEGNSERTRYLRTNRKETYTANKASQVIKKKFHDTFISKPKDKTTNTTHKIKQLQSVFSQVKCSHFIEMKNISAKPSALRFTEHVYSCIQ